MGRTYLYTLILLTPSHLNALYLSLYIHSHAHPLNLCSLPSRARPFNFLIHHQSDSCRYSTLSCATVSLSINNIYTLMTMGPQRSRSIADNRDLGRCHHYRSKVTDHFSARRNHHPGGGKLPNITMEVWDTIKEASIFMHDNAPVYTAKWVMNWATWRVIYCYKMASLFLRF